MSKNAKISHSGRVVAQKGTRLTVEIVSHSACGSCSAANLCSASESKSKLIEAFCDAADKYRIGEEVIVEGEESMGMKAVALSYLVPLLLIVGSLIVCRVFELDEGAGGIISLLTLIPFYFALWLFRHRLDKTFKFKIKKQIM